MPYQTLMNAGIIPDNIQPGALEAYIFESPFKDELALGFMLAGSSGKAVVRFFAEEKPKKAIALGQLLAQGQLLPGLERISTLNACQFPLDPSIYLPGGLRAGLVSPLVAKVLDRIRRGDGHLLAGQDRLLYDAIIKNFRDRLLTLPSDALLVPCGDGARRMVADAVGSMCPKDYAGTVTRIRFVNDAGHRIYHPAFGGWSRNQGRNAPTFNRKGLAS